MTKEVNDINFLENIYERLKNSGIKTFVFGGWAEELIGVIKPREHKDIDLLYLADNFELVDRFIKENDLLEVIQKRFDHKRAFEMKGVLVEIVLVSQNAGKYLTNFFGNYEFEWPTDTFQNNVLNERIAIASLNSLKEYRHQHKSIMNKAVPIAMRQAWS
ncbi:MAG: hypothetical protein HYT64_00315 [Candidatus Yanofskybacteria bacterium]|nr:hypothetical protein [Candidatus Yanofskybacteria bacterium]